MEEEKKKTKYWKKKNKQTKTKDEFPSSAAKATPQDQNDGSKKDHQRQCSEIADVQDNGGHCVISMNELVLAESERQCWLEKEASLQEMIKQLQNEKDSQIHREASLEIKILQLQSEKDSWHHQEGSLEQEITQLLQEKAALSVEEKKLQEKVRQFEREKVLWVEKENSSKGMIASLNDDKTRLQIQVMELEESRKNFSQENQRLMDDLSVLQSQIKDLEWSLSNAQLSAEVPQDAEEGEDLNSQIEAACALVVKLIAENAELVEKVNELQIELDRQSIKTGVSSVVFPKSIVASANATIPNPVVESIEGNAISVEIVNSSDRTLVTDERIIGDCADIEYDALGQDSLQTGVSGEITQIPLEENGAQDLGSQALTNKEKESDIIALTDAPLTGAPFRLISFIAKYVSGDDLVLKNSVYSK